MAFILKACQSSFSGTLLIVLILFFPFFVEFVIYGVWISIYVVVLNIFEFNVISMVMVWDTIWLLISGTSRNQNFRNLGTLHRNWTEKQREWRLIRIMCLSIISFTCVFKYSEHNETVSSVSHWALQISSTEAEWGLWVQRSRSP